MSELTWVDKSTWGPGPWQDEPDKINWTDAATGLPCMIVRGNAGALCGYVGVPEEHPLYGVDYTDHEITLEVHGGVTFTGGCQKDDREHGICHVPEPGEPDDVWWIGFDCAHAFDAMPRLAADLREARERHPQFPDPGNLFGSHYRDVAYVKAECADLAQQLAELGGAW